LPYWFLTNYGLTLSLAHCSIDSNTEIATISHDVPKLTSHYVYELAIGPNSSWSVANWHSIQWWSQFWISRYSHFKPRLYAIASSASNQSLPRDRRSKFTELWPRDIW